MIASQGVGAPAQTAFFGDWSMVGIDIEEAQRWIDFGVQVPSQAVYLRRLGAESEDVAQLLAEGMERLLAFGWMLGDFGPWMPDLAQRNAWCRPHWCLT